MFIVFQDNIENNKTEIYNLNHGAQSLPQSFLQNASFLQTVVDVT
jgi:hypothetical protein